MGGCEFARWLGVVALVGCSADSDAPELDHSMNAADVGAADSGAADSGAGDARRAFDAGSEPGRNAVEPGEICARFAAIQCAGERFCCESGARSAGACDAEMQGLCSALLHLDEVAASPAVNFDLARLGDSFAELERRAALCDPAVAAWTFSPEGFAGSVKGTLGDRDDCTPAGGLDAPLPELLIALMSCRSANRLACLPSANGFACSARSSRAGRCFSDLNCGDGLYCDNPEASFDGRCAPRKAEGEDCAATNECASFMCRGGRCAAEDDVQAAYCAE